MTNFDKSVWTPIIKFYKSILAILHLSNSIFHSPFPLFLQCCAVERKQLNLILSPLVLCQHKALIEECGFWRVLSCSVGSDKSAVGAGIFAVEMIWKIALAPYVCVSGWASKPAPIQGWAVRSSVWSRENAPSAVCEFISHPMRKSTFCAALPLWLFHWHPIA